MRQWRRRSVSRPSQPMARRNLYIHIYLLVCIYGYTSLYIHVKVYPVGATKLIYTYIFLYASMYVCICVCVYVCMCLCVYVGAYVCMYACMYVCLYVCMCACMCAGVYVFVYLYVYVRMYVCVYVCMCVCMYVWMCVCMLCMCLETPPPVGSEAFINPSPTSQSGPKRCYKQLCLYDGREHASLNPKANHHPANHAHWKSVAPSQPHHSKRGNPNNKNNTTDKATMRRHSSKTCNKLQYH